MQIFAPIRTLRRHRAALLLGLLACGHAGALRAEGTSPPPAGAQKEIKVTLFGQPCSLTGPLNETALTAIHSISPERIPPALDANSTREALDKVKKATDLPPALDQYRERLTRRLEAQSAYANELSAAMRTGKNDGLLAAARKHVRPAQLKRIEAQVRKLATRANLKARRSQAVDQLTEAYNDAIEPHPEEDFHRAIGRIGVSYSCSFEESESEAGAPTE
jgi:hypothetical protein